MDEAAKIGRLYDQHAQALFGFLLNFTHNEADTRDALQEVFRKLTARPALLNAVRDERAFLLRLAHNVAIDSVRRRARRQQTDQRFATEAASVFAPSVEPDVQTFRRKLAAALAELPAEQRAVVHLKLWEQMTFEAIAATLDLSPHTAASRYRYGIDKLRERLRPLYEEITSRGRI